jgi:hypothetical protein
VTFKGTIAPLCFQLALIAAFAFGQETGNASNAGGTNNKTRIPAVQDWSYSHSVFSNPSNAKAGSNGSNTANGANGSTGNNSTGHGQNNNFLNNPRYTTQQNIWLLGGKNNPPGNPAVTQDSANYSPTTNSSNSASTAFGSNFAGGNANSPTGNAKTKPAPKPTGDWSVALGPSTSGALAAEAPLMYPAKFSFDLNAGPSCTADFVVYGENATGTASGGAGTPASVIGTFSGTAASGTISVTVGGISVPLMGSSIGNICGVAGSDYYETGASVLQEAISYAGQFNTCTTHPHPGYTAYPNTPGTGQVTISANTAPGSISTGSFVTNFSWGTVTPGTGGTPPQPSIVSLNNLYTGAAVAATDTGTFTSQPLTTDTITVTNGGNQMILQTNATGAIATGTFIAGPVNTGKTITVNTGTNITLTPGGTAGSGGGTFSTGVPYATDTIHLTGPSGTATFTSSGTKATTTGTFTGVPSLTADAIQMNVTGGGGNVSLSPGGTASSIIANFGTSTQINVTDTISLTTYKGAYTFKTSATPATASGAFSAAPALTGQSETINGVMLSPAGTQASISGTFGGTPTAPGTITVTAGPGSGSTATFTMSNPTPAKSTATFGTAPVTSAQTVTVNPNSTGTITLSAGGTQATITATFTGSATQTGQFLPGTWVTSTFTQGSAVFTGGSNTATMKPTGSYGYFRYTGAPCNTSSFRGCGLSSGNSTADSVTLATSGGSTKYTFSTSAGSGAVIATTAATASQNLAAAIMQTTGMCTSGTCYGSGLAPPSGITASYDATNDVIYFFNNSGLTLTVTWTDNGLTHSNFIGNSVPATSGGTLAAVTASCTGTAGTITGVFVATATTSTGGASAAGNLKTAVNDCLNLGMTATSTANTITVAPPSYGTFTVSGSDTFGNGYTTPVATAGTGSVGCTGGTTGTFMNASDTTTLASNVQAAFAACANANISTSASTNTVIVTTAATGPSATLASLGGTAGVTWNPATSTTGGNGVTGCSNLTGTYGNNGLGNNDLATQLANAIGACSGLTTVTASASSATVTVTYKAPGSLANLGAALSGTGPGGGVFPGASTTWTVISSGTPGSAGCSGVAGTFVNSGTPATLNTNFNTALSACVTGGELANTTYSAGVVSTTIAGPGATSFTTSTAGSPSFTWTAAAGGVGAANTCSGTTVSFKLGTGTGTAYGNATATNFIAALTACTGGLATSGVTIGTPVNGTFTITANAPGAFTTFTGDTTTAASGVFTWGAITNGADLGAPTCTGASGQFINSNLSTAALGTNFYNALSLCTNVTSAATVTSTAGGAIVATLAIGATNAKLTYTENSGVFGWTGTSPLSGGNGTAGGSCSGGTGLFGLSTTPATMAGYLVTAINACTSSTGVTATNGTLGAFTLTVASPGNLTFNGTGTVVQNSNFFAWGTFNAGMDGTQNTCTSSTIGTYVNSTSLGTLGSNLQAALTACAGSGYLAASVTAATNGVTVTTTAKGAGVTITDGGTLSPTGFSWSNTAGTAGSSTCPSLGAATYATSATTSTLASNLASSINICNTTFSGIGVTATSSGAVVTVAAATGGATGNSITMADTSAGFAWTNPTLIGGADAGICNSINGGQPQVAWSYDTHTGATGGPITTSTVLSLDGSQVIFVESISGGSVLHILRPNPAAGAGTATDGTVAAPNTVPTVIDANTDTSVSDWTDCLGGTTACMLNLTYTTATNTLSSPFLDYNSNNLYVGDDNGELWQITNVGVTTGITAFPSVGWSSVLHTGNKLTAPVLNYANGNVYVGDSSGEVFQVSSAGGPAITTNTTEFTSITDSPVIDNVTNYVYVYGRHGEVNTSSNGLLVQFDPSLASPVVGALGTQTSGTLAQIHMGAFSNEYLNGPDPSYGFVYVCGKSAAGAAVLYRFGFNSMGVMSSSNSGGPLALTTAGGTGDCSPLSEVFNANQGSSGTDWLFVGVPDDCAFGGATTGCVMSFEITGTSSTTPPMPTAAFATGASAGGTSGIVVDNISTDGRASSLYFTTLGTPGCSNPSSTSTACAVQFTQAGLQ